MSDNKQVQAASTNQPASRESERESQRAVLPRVDVYEDESGITLLADLPGVPRDNLELNGQAGDAHVSFAVEDEEEIIPAEGPKPAAPRNESSARKITLEEMRKAGALAREKIERDPSDPQRIATVRGVGYRFEG